jgi:uncharacterized protein YlxP (DUF503 family)
VHAAAVEYDLHIGHSRSLKEKRAVVRPLVEGLQRRFRVSAAEVDHQDQWQRTVIGVAAVSGSHTHLSELLDTCDRFVWSHPEIEVLSAERRWLDGEG